MTNQPSEWAVGEAARVVEGIMQSDVIEHRSIGNVSFAVVNDSKMLPIIALALDAARNVPDGCVRLPDGSERQYYWLDRKDDGYGQSVGGMQCPKTGEWRHMQVWFSNDDIAAEAARKDANP